MGEGSGAAVSCGAHRSHSPESTLLWLWQRPAAVALIGPLTWEPPYAADVILKSKKKGGGVKSKEQRSLLIGVPTDPISDNQIWSIDKKNSY